jgi:hypothetical protein
MVSKKIEKKEERSKINIFKIAFISGIILVFLGILGGIISSAFQSNVAFVSIWSIFQGILVLVATAIFTLGFYYLGKKYESKFLRVMAILMIIFVVITYLINIFFISPSLQNLMQTVVQTIQGLGYDLNALTSEQAQILFSTLFSNTIFMGYLGIILLGFGIYILFSIIFSILFGISLLKVKDKVQYAKAAGVLEIIGGATLIIFIGLFFMVAAFIIELIIFYKESKK